nr:HtaA domain-containing protein [Lysinibacter cavernae]
MSWGFKASWRNYVTTFAGGTISTYAGATVQGDGTYSFPESSDSDYNSLTGEGTAKYFGGVDFLGTGHGFDLRMQNPWVTVAADGTVTVSAETSVSSTANPETVARVTVATFAGVPGQPTASDTQVSWASMPGVISPTIAPSDLSRYAGQASDNLAFSAAATEDAPVTPVFEPKVEVFKADGVTPIAQSEVHVGDSIVVKGSGFDPAANVGGRGIPIPATLPQGNYIVFGSFLENWRPSAEAPATARVGGPQKWATTQATLDGIPERYKSAVENQWTELDASGSFTATLEMTEFTGAKAPLDAGRFGVYTYGAGSVNNAAQEKFVPVNFTNAAAPVAPVFEPKIEVFKADGVTPLSNASVVDGDTIVVKGTGFDPASNVGGAGVPIPATLPQGTFVVFGSFASNWKPSANVPSSQRAINNESRKWALAESVLNQVPEEHRETIRGQWVNLAADGSFTAELKIASPATPIAGGNWGVYTYAGGLGNPNASQELSVPVNYTAKTVDPDPGTETPTGALNWAFKSEWSNYVLGMASGQINAVNGATKSAGNVFGFAQATGSTYDTAKKTGVIKYSGAIQFVSELHGFDIVLQNPWVTFAADGSAVISAEMSTSDTSGFTVARVDIAKLASSAGILAADTGVVNWANLSTTLLPTLEPSTLKGFYSNTAGAPVSFTYGGSKDEVVTPPTPKKPVVTSNVQTVSQGAEMIFTAKNYAANEKVDITVYSTPVKVGTNPTANADGEISQSWTVPADFELGEHRVEIVGASGTATATFTVVEPITTSPIVDPNKPCVANSVAGASFAWGVRDSFVSYINGPAAKGAASIGWGSGSGTFNQTDSIGKVAFGGGATFTGHGTILNIVMSNPQVQITGPNTGVLLMDVTSNDSTGKPNVSASGLTLATLSLPAAVKSGGTVSWSGVGVTLTTAGAQVFDGYYKAGEAMNSASFSFPLGAEVACDDYSNPASYAAGGKLAHTGSDSNGLMGLLAVTMLLGLGLVVIRRRRLNDVPAVSTMVSQR